jgi:CRP/FNR family transcriptional regulator
MLGTTPETLSRTLKKMAGMELVRTEGREIRILDRSRLEELAGEEGEKRGDRR